MGDRNKTTLNWFGYQIPLGVNENKPLGVFLGFLLAILAVVAGLMLVGAVNMIFGVFFGEAQTTDLRGPAMMFAAIIGFPLVVWRSVVAQKQTDHAGDVLFNDKLNEAVQDLHAQRQVTVEDDEGVKFNAWEDDIIRRNGAIDRLEALAVERPTYAPRIARMLCVYLKEMSMAFPVENRPAGHKLGEMQDDLYDWANELSLLRTDMQSAFKAIGEAGQKAIEKAKLELRHANLQSLIARDLVLGRCDLTSAKLDGSIIASFEVYNCKMDWTEQINTLYSNGSFSDTSFHKSLLIHTDFSYTKFTNCGFGGAKFTSAILHNTRFENCDFNEGNLYGKCRLSEALLEGAAFRSCDLSRIENVGDFAELCFGDSSVALPIDIDRPNHWPDTVLDDAAYEAEYTLFKQDPQNYIPPQDRNA